MHKQENNTDPIDKLFLKGFEDANEEIPDFLIEDILDKISTYNSSAKTEDQNINRSLTKSNNIGIVKSALVLSVLANIIFAFLWLNDDEKTNTEYQTIQKTDTVYIEKINTITKETTPIDSYNKSNRSEKKSEINPFPISVKTEKETLKDTSVVPVMVLKKQEENPNIIPKGTKTSGESEIENPHSLDYFMQKTDSTKGTRLFKEK